MAAHAYSPEAIRAAVTNGVRTIEHGNLLDEATAALMAEHGAFLVPTLVTYDAMERRGTELGLSAAAQAKNREVLDEGRTAIRLARRAGVRIGFGTDLMGELHDEQLHGLRLQADVEGPLATLRAATSVNAELLGRDEPGQAPAGRGRRPARPGRQPPRRCRRAVGEPGTPGQHRQSNRADTDLVFRRLT